MMSHINKLVLSAAFISPLLLSTPTYANMAPLKIDQTAVNQLTTSVIDTLSAYELLQNGNKSEARRLLSGALRQMEQAVAKDASLGIAQVKATQLHSDLKRIHKQLDSLQTPGLETEFRRVLQNAGIQTST